MSIKETLVADMKVAMREKDTIRLETIRLLRAAIQRKEVDERIQLDDEGVLQIIQKMVKQCTDAAQQFIDGNREDLADKEKANISILETYLPEQLSAQEIETLIQDAMQQTGAATMKDMGKVMGLVKSRSQGRADMGAVSLRIKSLLS
jgi:uncharacterized protein YqeY